MKKLPLLSSKKAKRIIITFHSLGDLDAVCSATALAVYFGKKAIIAPPDSPNSSARRFLQQFKISTTPFSEIKLSKDDVLIGVDSASPVLMSHLVGLTPDLIIDHHMRFGGEIRSKKEINDSSASSTSEILYFMLKPKDRLSCTALLLGIISDSAFFKYATPKTFEAAGNLLQNAGLSYEEILSLSNRPESFSERVEMIRACQTVGAEKVGEFLVATAVAKSYESHFADALVHLGADLAFVGMEEGNEKRISARMRPSLKGKVNLEKLMFEIGQFMGGSGGGHTFAGAASGTKNYLHEVLSLCLKLSEEQILSSESGKIKKIEW